MVFGTHLILDANKCDEIKIKDLENINNFINDLCKIGNMQKKGNLIVEEFEDNEFNRMFICLFSSFLSSENLNIKQVKGIK
jgi:hypothetical protein